MPKPPEKSLRTDWGEVADWYDDLVGEDGSEFHRAIIIPGVLRLLNAAKGAAILDVACGQGVLCRALQERGAEVTGVDAAHELIEAAKKRGPAEIRYENADVLKLGFLPPERFQSAACVLAIQNIQALPELCLGISRVLKPMGQFVVIMTHPAFRGPKESSWGWDEKTKTQYRRVDRYLVPRKSPIVTHPGRDPGQYTWTFHRPISAYVKALRKAGLFVDAMEEWASHKHSDSGPRAAAENQARKEIPMFLAMRAVKIPAVLSMKAE